MFAAGRGVRYSTSKWRTYNVKSNSARRKILKIKSKQTGAVIEYEYIYDKNHYYIYVNNDIAYAFSNATAALKKLRALIKKYE
jgi:hypothetical protein